ncbi:MAG: TRAP transporter small permease [Syntrophomonadaceae bacterium]|jgi:TRAP-type C4-dicarboxylate transport system permease small subunit
MKYYAGIVENISRLLDKIAALGIVLIMLIVVSNIILRVLFKQPILGTVDYVNILSAISIGLAVAYCAFQNGHIAIEYLINKMSKKSSEVAALLVNLLALGFWSLASWQMGQLARSMSENGLVSTTSLVPLSPVVYAITLGFVVICLVLLLNVISSVKKVIG